MASEILRRNPTSTGNRRVFTWAGWVKFNKLSTIANCIWYAASSGSSEFNISLVSSTGALNVYDYAPSAYQYQYVTSRLFRDFSNWFHLVVAVDTTQFREDDRFKIYVNGVLYNGSYSTEITIGGINHQTRMNTPGEINVIGQNTSGGVNYDANCELTDLFMIDGQALTPDVFGFYKVGKGYISAGSTQATDFRPGQWVPKTPRVIKTAINNNGGFGVNGFYLPMNDSNNFGADFHGEPNSIITLNEKLPQPRVGVASTANVGLGFTDALRADPYAANLVLALPFVSSGLSSGFGDYSAAIKGSGSAKTLTLNGGVSIASTASYYGTAGSFNGSNAYLTTPNTGDFDFGSGDFTIEYWAYDKTVTGERRLLYLYNTAQEFLVGHSGQAVFFAAYGSDGNLFGQPTTGNVLTINQWNHIAVEKYKTNLTIYVNGVAGAISTTYTGTIRSGQTPLYIGYDPVAAARYFNGYIQDLRIYKGVAKYTGGFDVPRPYTPVGIATWRAVPDTTANNFATLNPLIEARPSSGTNSPSNSTIVTFAGGNLDLTNSASAGNAQRMYSFATIGISTGRWYWEVRAGSNDAVAITKGFQQLNYAGVLGSGSGLEASVSYYGGGSVSIANTAYYSTATTLTPPTFDTTNIIGIAVSANSGLNNLTVQWFKDGVGVSTLTGIGATSRVLEWFPSRIVSSSGSGGDTKYNFGQNPSFSGNTTAGTYADTNGKGLFKYQPPSGFLALCEDNLPTPAIANPGRHFKTVLYTGDGNSGRSIVGVGFTPDLVWIKSRDTLTGNNILVDSVRGSMKTLFSEYTLAEYTDRGVHSFNADGFTTAAANGDYSYSGANYVAWCWKAGAGTTSTNTNGSITSVVSANQDAGFSIVSYTGTGASATVGHGLGKVPKMVIVKNRDRVASWLVRHSSLPANQTPLLENTVGYITTNYWESTYPSSTVFTISNNSEANANNERLIAYCWAEIEGFSKFGSYVGNGNADGPFVYCGFKPARLMIKRTDSTGDWYLFDSSRNSSNPVSLGLLSNTVQIDADYVGWGDFLSNGFKIRRTDSAWNASGGTYIFAAYAESPFQTANAK